MAIEQTLALVKPDGVRRGLIGEILHRYERKGLTIIGMRFGQWPRGLVEDFYAEHSAKPFFSHLVDIMVEGPILAVCLEGPDAVRIVRLLNGPTKLTEAPPGSIRGDFGTEGAYNVVHGSDSVESAERELKFVFSHLQNVR